MSPIYFLGPPRIGASPALLALPRVPDLALPYFLATPPDPRAGWPRSRRHPRGQRISSQLLRFCQRLAAEGYVVVAPDLFFRVGGTESDDAMTLIRGLDFAQAAP